MCYARSFLQIISDHVILRRSRFWKLVERYLESVFHWCCSEEMKADLLTKVLPLADYRRHRARMMNLSE